MSSDSTKFDLTDTPIRQSLEIAFSTAPGGKATHWRHQIDKNRIILAWSAMAGKDYTPFLTPITVEQAIAMLPDWIEALDHSRQPDHDGDNDKSFRIYCEDWGFVDHNHYAFAAIEPAWAMYGK